MCRAHPPGGRLRSKERSPGIPSAITAGTLAEFPGATPLAVNLYDAGTGYRIEMKSKKYSINVCEGLLLALEHLGVSYSVLK